MKEITAAELASLVDGELQGDGACLLRGVAPLESAGEHDLSFIANRRYLSYLSATRAPALLAPHALEDDLPARFTIVRVDDPHAALARVLETLYPEPEAPVGVHSSAVIGEGVELGTGVYIGPYVVIGDGCRVGDRSRIGAHTVVGREVVIGSETVIFPQVTLYDRVRVGDRCRIHSGARIGTDGFGYVFSQGAHQRVPQVGGCRIGDDVEIGANTTIDRGSIGDTVVGRGTKIDNLVHLGHNVRVGDHAIIIAQVGISGSCTIGDGAVLAGQAGIAGHLSIGPGARVGAQAGVIGNVAAGETVSGYPARPHREALRAQAALSRLPDLAKSVRRLERGAALQQTNDS